MTSPEPACEHLSQPAPGLRGGVPQDAVDAGSRAIHEAECSDDTCIASGHEGHQSDFNDDMSRTVLEAAAPHIAPAPAPPARELEQELETRQAALIAAHNERARISQLAADHGAEIHMPRCQCDDRAHTIAFADLIGDPS